MELHDEKVAGGIQHPEPRLNTSERKGEKERDGERERGNIV